MKELRVAELRATTPAGDNHKDDLILEGYPIVFDTPTKIQHIGGEYTEIIQRGALDQADLSDSRLLVNHDSTRLPLARSGKTMTFSIEPAGLKMRAQLPQTEEGRSAYEAVKRGDLDKMSFAFKVPEGGSSYDAKTNTRTITKIEKVYEISLVNWPAYPQTSVEARSQMDEAKQREGAKRDLRIKINQILKRSV